MKKIVLVVLEYAESKDYPPVPKKCIENALKGVERGELDMRLELIEEGLFSEGAYRLAVLLSKKKGKHEICRKCNCEQ